MIELVIMLAVIAVVVSVAFLTLTGMNPSKAAAVAGKLQSDIAYAQGLAMARNARYRVYFNSAPSPTPQGYGVFSDPNSDGNWVDAAVVRDPAGGGNLSVVLNSGTYAGVTLGGGLAGSFVEFDSLGRPYGSGGDLATSSVNVVSGSAMQTVTIQTQTGRVTSP